MDMQNVKNLTIPEGGVKTIHDKDSRLLWGAVGYNTTYRGDTSQQTYSGKNLFNGVFEQGNVWSSSAAHRLITSQSLQLKNGQQYVLSFTNLPSGYRFAVILGETPIYPGSGSTLSYDSNWQTTTHTFTSNGNFYFGIVVSKSDDAPLFPSGLSGTTWQLEEGSTPTSYEPYVGGTASPNPDYPQPVNVVTGTQTVNITGKNLFNSYIATKPYWQAGTLVVNPDGTFTVSGNTGSNNYFQLGQTLGTLCPNLKVGDQVYLYLNTTSAAKRIYIGETWADGGVKTVTQAMLNAAVVIYGGYQQTDTIKIMITKALETNYEAYQGKDFTVGLTSKNLLNLSTTATSGVSFDPATNTYSSSTRLGASTWVQKLVATSDTYTFSCSSASQAEMRYCFSDQNLFAADDIITLAANTPDSIVTNGNRTVTNSNNAKYLYVTFRAAINGTTGTLVEPMLEVGSTATTYGPYYNYELCKINTYQDYIYKSGDDWYVHKACGKYIADGNTSWSQSAYGVNTYLCYPDPPCAAGQSYPTTACAMSNCFTGVSYDDRTVEINNIVYTAHGYSLTVRNTPFNTIADLTTFCTNNNPVFYYMLATSTNTKITDSTLIAQLNAIHEWLTRYGYQATVSGNLPMIVGRTNL